MKDLRWRGALVLAIFVVALVYLLPTLGKELPEWWVKFFPDKKINLGLDLQGGMHLVLEVESDKAVENTVERLAQEIKVNWAPLTSGSAWLKDKVGMGCGCSCRRNKTGSKLLTS